MDALFPIRLTSLINPADECELPAKADVGDPLPLTAASAVAPAPSVVAIPDEALLACISEGDKEALSLLFRRYARVVRGAAYKVLRDPAEADDLLQEIFLLVYRLAKTFDPAKSPARFWLLQMTHHRAISRRRYLTSRHFYDHQELEETRGYSELGGGVLARVEDSTDKRLEREEMVQAWFEELSERQRQTLQLFFFEGYSLDEIAARLGQTVGNTRHHYYRGLERLRRKIAAGKLPGREALW